MKKNLNDFQIASKKIQIAMILAKKVAMHFELKNPTDFQITCEKNPTDFLIASKKEFKLQWFCQKSCKSLWVEKSERLSNHIWKNSEWLSNLKWNIFKS